MRGDEPGESEDASRPSYARLAARFRPVFERIAADALAREQAETRADAQLGWLFDAGFGRLRVPARLDGLDARLSDLLRLLAELAEADVNVAHVWRNHFSFGEDRRHASEQSDVWLRRLADGELVGGGWSERGRSAVDDHTTLLSRTGDGGWRVDGHKYYATGSIYARWTTVRARTDDGRDVVALVDMRQPGVVVDDDWDGFGQRVTGSGGVRYLDARVDDAHVLPYAERYTYQEQYYQSVLNALLVGIGRAVLRDGIAALRARGRAHPHNVATDPTDDPQLLQVIGEVSALVAAAEGAFERSLGPVDDYVEGRDADPSPSLVAVSQAQLVASTATLEAATRVFDALGASGTSQTLALDRHWRNARTLASHNPRVARARIVGDRLVNGPRTGRKRDTDGEGRG